MCRYRLNANASTGRLCRQGIINYYFVTEAYKETIFCMLIVNSMRLNFFKFILLSGISGAWGSTCVVYIYPLGL